MAKTPVLGVKIGYSNSSAAIYHNGTYQMVPVDGSTLMPSYVLITEDEPIIGIEAKRLAKDYPERTIFGIKNIIGLPYNDDTVQKEIKKQCYEFINLDGHPNIQIEINGRKKIYSLEKIYAMFLAKLKKCAEDFIGSKIDTVVIAIPAMFEGIKGIIRGIKEAAKIAKFDNVYTITDYLAITLAYGIHEKFIESNEKERTILSFYIGGSFMCITVIVYCPTFNSSYRQGFFGGLYIDDSLIRYFLSKYEAENPNINIYDNKSRLLECMFLCQKVKMDLSKFEKATFDMKSIGFKCDISRQEFENLWSNLLRGFDIQLALDDVKLDKSQIDDVLIAGGSLHIPIIQNKVKNFFKNKKIHAMKNLEEVITIGAAIQGNEKFFSFNSIFEDTHLLLKNQNTEEKSSSSESSSQDQHKEEMPHSSFEATRAKFENLNVKDKQSNFGISNVFQPQTVFNSIINVKIVTSNSNSNDNKNSNAPNTNINNGSNNINNNGEFTVEGELNLN